MVLLGGSKRKNTPGVRTITLLSISTHLRDVEPSVIDSTTHVAVGRQGKKLVLALGVSILLHLPKAIRWARVSGLTRTKAGAYRIFIGKYDQKRLGIRLRRGSCTLDCHFHQHYKEKGGSGWVIVYRLAPEEVLSSESETPTATS